MTHSGIRLSMRVYKVVRDGDRTLLYGFNPNYHILAPADVKFRKGETIYYEPGGINFGWYVSKSIAPVLGR